MALTVGSAEPNSEPLIPHGVFWNVSEHTCAMNDSERHLGHAFRDGDKWLAYDAVHSNPKGTDFRFLGRFKSSLEARRAIERSVVSVIVG
jgi:hypothetical protein